MMDFYNMLQEPEENKKQGFLLRYELKNNDILNKLTRCQNSDFGNSRCTPNVSRNQKGSHVYNF